MPAGPEGTTQARDKTHQGKSLARARAGVKWVLVPHPIAESAEIGECNDERANNDDGGGPIDGHPECEEGTLAGRTSRKKLPGKECPRQIGQVNGDDNAGNRNESNRDSTPERHADEPPCQGNSGGGAGSDSTSTIASNSTAGARAPHTVA